MVRREAINLIIDKLGRSYVYVSTTGKISRELNEIQSNNTKDETDFKFLV